jgi:tetratricopeptide (TPR) repeat protein
VVLGAAVGATFYFIKAPDDKRLQEKGEKELANAQYAFAVQTLTKASQAKPQDAKIMLELARAYVGVDQIDKAWDCVSRAQKLGTGVIAEPTLASDLANYYRRRGKYDKAVALLRPLAKADISGKKAELADLDAAWGDDLLAEDKLDQALRCWEEVRELREGSRFTEAEARLSTIYQKLANNLASKNDDEHALAYLTKLNNIAQNARNYELAAQIYEREGKLDKSIEQLRKAANLSSKNTSINQKLAGLLARRGKELLDEGSADAGYAFLQQAKDLNPQSSLPNATLKAVAISVDPASHQPKITGELWNPSDQAISSLSFKVELWDDESAKTMWDKEDRLVDQFTPPLGPHESKHFEYLAPIVVTMDGNKELRTYIDGALYKEYPIGKKSEKTASEKKKDSSAKKPEVSGNMEKPSIQTRKPAASETAAPIQKYTPSQVTQTEVPVPTAPALTPAPARTTPSSRGSSEEKTMKDLEM